MLLQAYFIEPESRVKRVGGGGEERAKKPLLGQVLIYAM